VHFIVLYLGGRVKGLSVFALITSYRGTVGYTRVLTAVTHRRSRYGALRPEPGHSAAAA
jgi:hypothetical protein